jgi:uncharacterized protein YcbX
LRACRAELIDDSEARLPLRVTLPDGETLEGDEIEAALCELLERRVRLERSQAPAEGLFAATGAHHDLAPVHLMTTTTIAHLRSLAPECDWDVRRFRPNLLLDDGARPAFAEDALLGARLHRRDGLELEVTLPTPRCVVPTRAHEELPADPRLLRALAREHSVELGSLGRQPCAGAYAEVVRPGAAAVGDVLDTTPPKESAAAVVAATLARLPH